MDACGLRISTRGRRRRRRAHHVPPVVVVVVFWAGLVAGLVVHPRLGTTAARRVVRRAAKTPPEKNPGPVTETSAGAAAAANAVAWSVGEVVRLARLPATEEAILALSREIAAEFSSREETEASPLASLVTRNPGKKTVFSLALASVRKACRYGLLVRLLERDRAAYAAVAGLLTLESEFGPVERLELPNLEDVPVFLSTQTVSSSTAFGTDDGAVVPGCALPNATVADSPLDWALLTATRRLYRARSPTPHVSNRPAIRGLLDEMLALASSRAGTVDEQREVVVDVLKSLMTPYLPPIYEFFVANKPWGPFATSMVAPVVFGFLVGPSTVNRRGDGQLGGLVVHKCKFLQESGCKGLCLHQCKLPAEQLFRDDLGMHLYVKPNFETQECQWSWGVAAPDPASDPAWPTGCLVGCPTRAAAASSSASSAMLEAEKKSASLPPQGFATFCS